MTSTYMSVFIVVLHIALSVNAFQPHENVLADKQLQIRNVPYCDDDTCGSNAYCLVENNKPQCYCKLGFGRDYTGWGECRWVCSRHQECDIYHWCKNRRCVECDDRFCMKKTGRVFKREAPSNTNSNHSNIFDLLSGPA